MFIKSGFEAEKSIKKLITTSLLGKLLMKASADEGQPTGSEGEQTPDNNSVQFNFEQMIAMARKEEKDKLYPRLKKLEEDNKALVSTNNNNLLKIGALTTELETLRVQISQGDTAKVTELQDKVTELEATLQALKDATPSEEAIRSKIEAEYEVKLYMTQQLALDEHKTSILPQFMGDVKGGTKEEIDTSIQQAIEKTLEIKKSLGLVDEEGKPINTTQPQTTPKKQKPPVANPSGGKEGELSLEEIRKLDPRSKEYAEWRKKQGLR